VRYITVAVGSFLLGIVCMFVFGNHISTVRRPASVFAQTDSTGSVFDGNRFTPIVPAPPRMVDDGNIVERQVIDLDGMTISNGIFRDTTFVYGGGAYSLRNTTVSGNIEVDFIGAAANTVQFLKTIGLLRDSSPPSPATPSETNTPRKEKTTIKTTIKGDFVSPYDGKK
jgi:hypothetical protein